MIRNSEASLVCPSAAAEQLVIAVTMYGFLGNLPQGELTVTGQNS
jgi:hypothetical protein